MWLFNKYKTETGDHLGGEMRDGVPGQRSSRNLGNAVTPNSIPEFVIPHFTKHNDREACRAANGSISTCSTENSALRSPLLRSPTTPYSRPNSPMFSDNSRCSSPSPSPSMSPRSANSLSPNSPTSPQAFRFENSTNVTADGDTFTEASRASLSLHQIPLYSPTLGRGREGVITSDSSSPVESPLICRTRRKLSRPKDLPYNGLPSPLSDSSEKENNFVYTPKRERSICFSPLNKLRGLRKQSTSSASESPVSTPSLARQARCRTNLPKDHSKRKAPKNLRRPRNLYERRRSSVDLALYSEQFSSTDASSVEPSPVILRRNSSGQVQQIGSPNLRLGQLRRVCLTDPKWLMHRLQKQSSLDLGELKFALEYFWETRQLKVTVIKAERIGGGQNLLAHNTNAYVKLYLMPGKQQRQHTHTVKRTKDPVFNEDFYFNGVNAPDFRHLKLRMKLFNKISNIKRDEFLGEVQVLLGTLDFSHEIRVWKDLQPKSEVEDLGMLNVSVCYQPRQKNMIVTMVKAKDLPRNSITGAPDPYVKVEFSICDQTTTTLRRQTRVRKKTTAPVFKEAFTFSVGNRSIEDIENNACIVLTMYDHDRIRADETIGEVRIGCRATEESELDHWRKIVSAPDQPVPRWHNLMELDEEMTLA
ncbi:uncharacterized protein LOC144443675 [Glandiceps talaboti]